MLELYFNDCGFGVMTADIEVFDISETFPKTRLTMSCSVKIPEIVPELSLISIQPTFWSIILLRTLCSESVSSAAVAGARARIPI